jgi:thioredoxin 1
MALDNFLNDISNDGIVVVDVYKEDCDPCQKFLRIFDRVESAVIRENAQIVKYNIAEVPELKDMYEITQVPTFLYFRDGQELHRHFGIKSIAEMVKIIQTL